MSMNVYPGLIVRNIKNQKRYKVTNVYRHSETQELMVGYHGMLGDHPVEQYWVRPHDLFCEKFEEVPGGLFG